MGDGIMDNEQRIKELKENLRNFNYNDIDILRAELQAREECQKEFQEKIEKLKDSRLKFTEEEKEVIDEIFGEQK
jgi:hypothetical protein